MPTHKIIYTLNRGVGAQVTKQTQVTNESEIFMEVAVPSPSTNLAIDFVAPLAQLKSIYISTDGTLTLETNDGTTPDDTFAFTSAKALAWNTDSLLANPFSADITGLFATVAGGGSTVNLKIYALLDATA